MRNYKTVSSGGLETVRYLVLEGAVDRVDSTRPSGQNTSPSSPACGLPSPHLLLLAFPARPSPPRVPPPSRGRARWAEKKAKRDHGLHLVRRPGALRLPLPPLRLPRVRPSVPLPHSPLRSRLLLFQYRRFFANRPRPLRRRLLRWLPSYRSRPADSASVRGGDR